MDYGSPVDGIRLIEEKVSIVYPDTGHVNTPEMRAEMLAWFGRWLKQGKAK